MELIIIRHGQTEWNREKRRQGHKDSPLTRKGYDQAQALGLALKDWLASNPSDTDALWISSPLKRAYRTAQIISQICCPEAIIETDKLLKENGFGDLEGLTDDEIEHRWPGLIAARKANHWDYRAPGNGESYADVTARVRLFISSQAHGRRLILVTHEVVSKSIRGAVLGLSKQQILALKHPQNCLFHIKGTSCNVVYVDDSAA